MFLALDANRVGEPLERDEAGDEVVLMDQESARTALLRGEFRVLSWAAAASVALLWLDNKELNGRQS